MAEIFTITIEKQGYKGDGIGLYRNKKVIVPFAVIGDVLEVKLLKENSKIIEAEIINILCSSKDRVSPPCKYFTICGGCDMQHLSPELYQKTKVNQVKEVIRRAGFNDTNIKFIPVTEKSRRKARFHVKDGEIGFYRKNSHNIISIESCEVLHDRIIEKLKKLREIKFNSNNDVEIVLTENDHIEIGKYLVKYNDYFLQSSFDTNQIVANLIKESLNKSNKLLDLFSGVGAYSLLLHDYVHSILAIEGDEKVESSINEVILNYNINNITFNLRDIFKHPLTCNELNNYDTIIINPPKNGAEPQFKEISNSNVKFIHIISCNPVTLERDLKYLYKAGFRLKKTCIIDQFKWSHHAEVYIYLEK
ncbi:MAG: class I SAM-dependent RNA methyltransferase [Sphingobacteriia bacterium]|nr:class I SAM-dependent RNA methyltransferase [Sphingobacteriia bacterium]